MVGADLAGLGHVRIVAQAVEQLGPVGLRVDRLQLDGFFEGGGAHALRPGVEVMTLHTAPDAGQSTQGTQVGQCVHIDLGGGRVDVGGHVRG
jgi:hypothetical protein